MIKEKQFELCIATFGFQWKGCNQKSVSGDIKKSSSLVPKTYNTWEIEVSNM